MEVHSIPLVRAGIGTYSQPVVYMREDCHICRAEGFSALTQVEIALDKRSIVAALNVVTEADWLPSDTAALSEAAWSALGAKAGEHAIFSHPEPPASASAIRAKVYGERLDIAACRAIIGDTVAHHLSDLDLAAFITACAGDRLDIDETIALTQAMQGAGKTLGWGPGLVLDKHCVGGLPGNRTTPIVVAIVAAAGYRIPKTSSRAITSPAGTADTMEVLAPVALDIAAMRRVVEAEGGCVVWGGGLDLSPADDLLIRVERPLDFDSDGQLVASILSKKAAAGSTHVLIDMPVGPTAKVRNSEAAKALSDRLLAVGHAIEMTVLIHLSDGSAPVGRGIGPALDARDLLAVLRREPDAPLDLRERALNLAGALLDLADADGSHGRALARRLLDSGAAEAKFMSICEAQGGFREPGSAPHKTIEMAKVAGAIMEIDNRRIAKIAKLAGAPGRKGAGVLLLARPGDMVEAGQPLYEIYAETRGELAWAQDYARSGPSPFQTANVPDAVLLGPDSESRQWVAQVARLANRPFEILEKYRSGDRDVEVSVPQSEALLAGTPVILDDIASSGRTLIKAIERLRAAGARPPVCLVIHAVFAGNACADILAAGAARVVTTDSMPHASNAISLAQALADACHDLQAGNPSASRAAARTTR